MLDKFSNFVFFSKNYFKFTISVSNSLYPDQAQHFIGPDLGPDCLQRISARLSSADDTQKTPLSGEELFKRPAHQILAHLAWADPEGVTGGPGLPPHPLENHKWLHVSLVRNPFSREVCTAVCEIC